VIARLAGRYFIYFCLFMIKILPCNLLYSFSKALAKLAFFISVKYRNRALNNLKNAFKDEKSAPQIKKIANNLFEQIAWGMAETTKYAYLKGNLTERIKNNIAIEGKEFLDKALSLNKGVILVSAHFGNFSLITYRLTQEGYPSNMIFRGANDPAVSKVWYNTLNRLGIRWIPAHPKKKSVSESLRWLKKNNVLCLFADQNKTTGVYVDFFGKPAGTVEGPALLHLRTKAPLLCAFIIRLSRDRHKIVITSPIDVKLTGNDGQDIYNITKSFTEIIEKFVREYPSHWWWVHNRWKGMDRLNPKH